MDLIGLLSLYGLPLVFGFVLLEQGGLPLPAAPVLVCAGALAERGAMRPEWVLVTAIVASLLADQTWFWLGRRLGRRLLAGICRISLSPDTCVRRTDALLGRHGLPLLLVAKFLPGVSAVAIPTAAASGLRYRRFLGYDLAGCVLWSGLYLSAGVIFSDEINAMLGALSWIGGWAFLLLASCLALYLGWRLLRRWQLRRLYRVVRITPEEMTAMLVDEPELLVLDARSALARQQAPAALPGVHVLGDRALDGLLPPLQRERTIVTFCSCPNEASAALVARRLLDAGYPRVRVFAGGHDALAALAAVLTARVGNNQPSIEALDDPDSPTDPALLI